MDIDTINNRVPVVVAQEGMSEVRVMFENGKTQWVALSALVCGDRHAD